MMNGFGQVVLFTLVLTFFLKLIADLLNLRASESGLPPEFQGVYEEDAYRKSQDYLRATTRFSLIGAFVDLLFLLVFWFAGGFNMLDQLLRAQGYNTVLTGVLYIGALLLLQGILGLPFTLYRTFVIEERFGFNKTTPKVFVADLLKTLFLALLIGTPVLAALLWFFEQAGPFGWLWAWGGLTLFTLLLQYVAPAWIMPIFNKFVPLEEGELNNAIMQYARTVGFPLTGIYVIDGSKRSSKANAFFTGFGKRKRIALFDTLVSNHSVSELVAVLAHEIGHYKKKHVLINMVLSMVNLGVVFYLLSVFMNNPDLFSAFFMQDISVYGSLVFFLLLYSPVEFVLSILLQALSRKHEYEADSFAVSTYSDGFALGEALKKLSRSNLSNLTPHALYVFLNYSHPPVVQRIRRINEHPAPGHLNH
ncbi:Ste24 endopeptidase [Chlorobium phaeobacteroides DSM 266]|jgi:STE24 endopeptidase|uniref:Ste24 endopeptidase n=2 Tax=Chlorobium phaeobacteroides TaxID=1096 RepID=A1BHP1_CHLPD|nr:Ste24 endopeptidase [Chlorobium phaeobacteroides DSM 266]